MNVNINLLLISLFTVKICGESLYYLQFDGSPDHFSAAALANSEYHSGYHGYVAHHLIKKRETNETDSVDNVTETTTVSVTSTPEDATTPTQAMHVTKPTISHPTTTPADYDPDSVGDDTHVDGYNTTFGHHKYYQSFSKHGNEINEYWVNLDGMDENIVLHEKLSNAYRRALMVNLSFAFPFYGHKLRNITIATGGFIYTGTFVHKWLAATQYIAPLMANFDTSTSTDATIKYYDNGTSLTVQWGNVVLQDNPQYGSFTFQVTLKDNGKIIFAYKEVPVNTSLIKDDDHPVKIGLSDAYIVEKTVFFIRKKTIYEYHKIDKKEYNISNQTAIIFEPVANCIQFQTCESCLTSKTDFQCKWCQIVGRCSDSVDRYRQDWLREGCVDAAISHAGKCADLPPVPPQRSTSQQAFRPPELHVVKTSSHVGTVIFLILLLTVMCFCAWLYYAYYHPHTSSGQLLIKYRPSTWSWVRGGAKYTAATMHSIHM